MMYVENKYGRRLTFAEKPLLVQHSDGISAQNSSLNERVQCKRHAGNFFFSSSFVHRRGRCRKQAAEVVQQKKRMSLRLFASKRSLERLF